MRTPEFLDCCAAPDLVFVRALYESAHDGESLHRCGACQTYWFYRFHEYVDFAGGDDDITDWLSPLSTQEGELLASAEDPEGVDLGFLGQRASWMWDRSGHRRVPNAPTHPWS